jgi:hypothetical protein
MDAAGVVPHLFLYYFTDANNQYRYTRNKNESKYYWKPIQTEYASDA